jgi:putative addiction module killer protein
MMAKKIEKDNPEYRRLIEIHRTDNYSCHMYELIKSETFDHWLSGLRDRNAKARIEVRMRRLGLGNPGDVKPVGEGVSEMRIDYGPGYRVYFQQRGPVLIILLCGGDKKTQDKDIQTAKSIAAQWSE